jgi:hypothetical protein
VVAKTGLIHIKCTEGNQEEFEDNKWIIIMVNKAKKDKRQRII